MKRFLIFVVLSMCSCGHSIWTTGLVIDKSYVPGETTTEEAEQGHQKWITQIVGMKEILKLGYGNSITKKWIVLKRRDP